MSAGSRAYNRQRRGRPYARIRAIVMAEETHCWRCGEPVNKSLSGMHDDGPMLGHIHSVIDPNTGQQQVHTLDRANFRLEHRRCGLSAGNRAVKPKQARPWW